MQCIVYMCIAERCCPCAVLLPNEICTVGAQVQLSSQKPTLSHKLSGNWRGFFSLSITVYFLIEYTQREEKLAFNDSLERKMLCI